MLRMALKTGLKTGPSAVRGQNAVSRLRINWLSRPDPHRNVAVLFFLALWMVGTMAGGAPSMFSEVQGSVVLAETGTNASSKEDGALPADFNMMSATQQRDVINALSDNGSEESLRALLDISLGKMGAKDSKWAARRFVKAIKDKRRAVELLESGDSEVQSIGLVALAGVDIDGLLVRCLTNALRSSFTSVRIDAARVIATATHVVDSDHILAALIESVATIDATADAEKVVGWGLPAREYKLREIGYFQHIKAMGFMYGEDVATDLARLTPKVEGTTRKCVIIARAFLGDQSIRPHLREIISGPSCAVLRSEAVESFRVIGTREDLAFLRNVATNDSLQVEVAGHGRVSLQTSEQNGRTVLFPIRRAAENVIRDIEGRAD